MSKSQHVQVAIVGGGVAGITLALAFERLGVQYALLEAYDSLAPNLGASVGLLPNGQRILDQLGLLEEIEQHTIPLQTWRHLDQKGELISTVNALSYYPSSFGYGGIFLERQKLQEIMAAKLRGGNGIIKTSARVKEILEDESGVTLMTKDGFTVTADLVVGADGVRSCVRNFIDLSQPIAEKVNSDKYISTRFACVYGVSTPTPGISAGECFSTYRESAAILGFTGKDGIIFWFVFEDLGESLVLSETPRYTAADIDGVCESVGQFPIAPGVVFHDIFSKKKIAMKVALEEGVAKVWHTDRTVLVGDAAHKMVPNAAMGANQAMESSACLVNELQKVIKSSSGGHLDPASLRSALEDYANLRTPRTSMIQERAGISCRAQLRHGGPAAAVLRELPTLTDADWLFRGFASLLDAPVLDGFPLTARGKFLEEAMATFKRRSRTRAEGSLKCSNEQLVGLSPILVENA
ncbi:FAD/NAD(P)-binding domain-containing protein [Lophiostoma macrostomum CBS 122681]|uniref:FAD/NAD(P)-binding domain-containing protein n=1 Tax=Lophiostoma macrostomum CBS 122681 TaxID=1314788 RepID=A0A6A6SSI1_9PLEO|nr:FAD/NAD(P)-binding domain-containing protein [Lophiostoma macrostomum CBS 122681]